jgi:hypothetical protein
MHGQYSQRMSSARGRLGQYVVPLGRPNAWTGAALTPSGQVSPGSDANGGNEIAEAAVVAAAASPRSGYVSDLGL